jgi:hypothetical protein
LDDKEGPIYHLSVNCSNVQSDQSNAHQHKPNKQRIEYDHNAKGSKKLITTNEVVSEHK